MTRANDMQQGGSHYRAAKQHWDMVERFQVPYLEATLLKYLHRYPKKGGPLDLDKAAHYGIKMAELARESGRLNWGEFSNDQASLDWLEEYFDANEVEHREREITLAVLNWADVEDLDLIASSLQVLAAEKRDVEREPAARTLTVCVDFDGVIHRYDSPWVDPVTIVDGPVPGAFEALLSYQRAGFDVCVYSSRSKELGGIEAMCNWFRKHGQTKLVRRLLFPTKKPAAAMTIDDRAFCFEGEFPDPSWIREFRPWNKRG